MPDLTPNVVAILKKYMRDPSAAVASTTALSELGIDLLDLPMILLDIEDAFDIHIDQDEEIEDGLTLHGLAACVALRLEAKRLQTRVRQTVPRSSGSWMSTGTIRPRQS